MAPRLGRLVPTQAHLLPAHMTLSWPGPPARAPVPTRPRRKPTDLAVTGPGRGPSAIMPGLSRGRESVATRFSMLLCTSGVSTAIPKPAPYFVLTTQLPVEPGCCAGVGRWARRHPSLS